MILILLQQAALVLNASRRFRYTLDLNKDEEREQRRRMIRAHAQVVRVSIMKLEHFVGLYVHMYDNLFTLFFHSLFVLGGHAF